jgi:cell wall-associated NlpC family hydrolase
LIAALAFACAGCGQQAASGSNAPHPAASARPSASALGAAHPQAVEPVAGAGGTAVAPASNGSSAGVSDSGPHGTLPQPTSLTTVEQELAQSGFNANPNQATLTPNLLAIAPVAAPPQVQEIINAGNEIAHLPYIWGGGHATYEDSGYDCSGSISFVLAASGLLKGTETAAQLMSYGDAGPGKWITIYASPGHTFMYIAGLRFDTVALAQSGSRWSNRSAADGGKFVARHPPGL